MPAYGKKILVFLTFVLGSHGDGAKEAAAFAVEKQPLLLLGDSTGSPKVNASRAVSLLRLSSSSPAL